jgi:hypothetical protein
MNRCLGSALLLLVLTSGVWAQTSVIVSDAKAITLATSSLAAMTGGLSVTDITLNAKVTYIAGSDNESGTGIFYAKGNDESLLDLSLDQGHRRELRVSKDGIPSASGKNAASTAQNFAEHNALTDAVWFSPVLSSLAQTSNPDYVFSYLGQDQKNGLAVEHLRVFRKMPADTETGILSRLSTVDFYLDSATLLPLVVDFKVHPSDNLSVDIPEEILFANYQVLGGVRIPAHIARLINGTVTLDIAVTSAVVNSGLADSQFTLQ